MRKLHEMAADIRSLLETKFQAVRLSTAAASPQLINELRAIGTGKLPAVAVIVDQGFLTTSNRVRDDRITLVLIDRFRAGSDEKTLSALAALEELFALFPADVTTVEGVHYLPVRFYSAGVDPAFVCFAYELTARQAII